MWEFLSGVEQDLWDEGEDEDEDEVLDWEDSRQGRFSMDSQTSLDWELASMINEFRVGGEVESSYVESYDEEEEEEDMVTPGRTVPDLEEGYFERGNEKERHTDTAVSAAEEEHKAYGGGGEECTRMV
jgi:hypothetical protein